MDFSDISSIKITMQDGCTEEYPYGSLEYVNFILRNAQDIIGRHVSCQQRNDDELRRDEIEDVRRLINRHEKMR